MRLLPSLVILVLAAAPVSGQPADYLDKIGTMPDFLQTDKKGEFAKGGTRNLDAVKPVGCFPTIIPRANSPRASIAHPSASWRAAD